MKKIEVLELSFDKEINEKELIDEFSKILDVDVLNFWDWDWAGSPSNIVETNFTYKKIREGKYLTFVRLLLNTAKVVSVLYEIEVGIKLSQKFACSVLINDPFFPDTYLEFLPTGKVNVCEEGETKEGIIVYNIPVESDLTIEEILNRYRLD